MKLYDADWAPSPRRVRMFLAEKGVEIDREKIDLAAGAHLGAAYLAVNPRGTVPALLLDDGTLIDESSAICRYIESLHPYPCLFGRTALEIALVEAWTRRIDDEGYGAATFAFRNRNRHMIDRGLPGNWPPIAQIPELVDRGRTMWACFAAALEARLAGRDWIAIDAYSYADLTALVAVDFARATKLDTGDVPPALAAWHARASARPSAGA